MLWCSGSTRRARSRLLAGLLWAATAAAWAQAAPPDDTLVALLREEASSYEAGSGGVMRDSARAVALYCEAARLGDAESQFRLGWIHANGQGVERSDAVAAFFFQIAAEQGIEQARRMLSVVGGPTTDVPECMRERAPAPVPAAAAPKAAPPATSAPPHIVRLVNTLAPQFKVEPQLALAIIAVESNFDPAALSPRNAKGLMQLIPDTASRFNVRNPYDPAQNIRGGMAYLRWLLAYFEGDVKLVAAAYNAGEGVVDRYRGVPPYLETRNYVERIVRLMGAESCAFDASAAAPSPQLPLIRKSRRAS
ncbi:Membrane-bound lytic murein transglycosylase C [Burkholderiaceae bacterium]|nr:Membrane-bound lytic murein transglycosylase C [Burkholderiaceae bacterium]